MRNRFDQMSKQFGQSSLGAFGATVTHSEITSDAQYADLWHEPDPSRAAERGKLGLLGRLTANPCLIEVYSKAPNAAEFRACVAKHLNAWRARDPSLEDPFLWIVCAGRPSRSSSSSASRRPRTGRAVSTALVRT